LENVLPILDGVLIMSVNPGFGGQSFIPYSLDKIKELNDTRKKRKLNFLIEVDGGVNVSLRDDLERVGADILVAGSAVFKSKNRLDAIKQLKGK
jgi:ribulose-phosphate 3-epimerase